jgi:GT2 family glycosyltransferase
MTAVGCVILSRGDRPSELQRAVESVRMQTGVTVEIVVVGNGWVPVDLPDDVATVALEQNAGVPAARNIGAAKLSAEILLFLDDDIDLVDADFLARAVAQFDADPALAVVQPRSVDPDGAPTDRRHVPRLRSADPLRSGDVAWFWEGASLIRHSAFDEVGQWPAEFFYGHEGIELAWRLVDRGYRIRYEAELAVHNPAAIPFRGPQHWYLNVRNRVWVARRNLPLVLAVGYLAVWLPATLSRSRGLGDLAAVGRGLLDGVRQPCGVRAPISWRGVWRLTRLGRPPIV